MVWVHRGVSYDLDGYTDAQQIFEVLQPSWVEHPDHSIARDTARA